MFVLMYLWIIFENTASTSFDESTKRNNFPSDSSNGFDVAHVMYLLDVLSWKEIVIIHDHYSEENVMRVMIELEKEHDILSTVMSLSGIKRSDYLDFIYRKYLYTSLNIIVFISTECSVNVTESDFVPSGTTDPLINTKSKWLIFPTRWCCSLLTSRFQTNLTNIAIVIPSENQNKIIHTLDDGVLKTVSGLPSTEKMFPKIRFKLNGKKIRIGIMPNYGPFEKNLNKLLDVMSGYLNFTYDIVISRNREWGLLTNGTWSGLVGQLVDHEVDLGLAPLTITDERLKSVDFVLPPFESSKLAVLYRKETSDGDTWFLFVRPFRLEVYMCTTLSFVVISVLFIYLTSRESNEPKYNRVANTLLYLFAALFLEGGHFNFQGVSARILFAFWLIFCVVLAVTYTATLLRSLIPIKVKPFDTIQELLDLPDWQIGVMGGSADVSILSNSKNEDIKRFWTSLVRNMESDPTILSPDEKVHLEKVVQGKYAFVVQEGERMIKSRRDCLLELNHRLFDLPSIEQSMAVPKRSPFKIELDYLIDRLQSTGLLEEIMKPQDNRLSQCSIIDDTVKPLILDNVKGVFALLAGCVVMAAIILIVEVALNSKRSA